jgi:hypothetical protein
MYYLTCCAIKKIITRFLQFYKRHHLMCNFERSLKASSHAHPGSGHWKNITNGEAISRPLIQLIPQERDLRFEMLKDPSCVPTISAGCWRRRQITEFEFRAGGHQQRRCGWDRRDDALYSSVLLNTLCGHVVCWYFKPCWLRTNILNEKQEVIINDRNTQKFMLIPCSKEKGRIPMRNEFNMDQV